MSIPMTPLTIFGLFAVTAMLVCYALEVRSRWFIPRLCRSLHARLGLRIPAGSVAVRPG
jgi:hypothetical protein